MQLRPNLDIYALRNNFEQNNQFQEKEISDQYPTNRLAQTNQKPLNHKQEIESLPWLSVPEAVWWSSWTAPEHHNLNLQPTRDDV